tara:strand:- start:1193 stop:1543 length:351 start_codon:yes stop_codon:yes gene_type:complete
MGSLNIVVVYHPNCKASTDFLIHVSKLSHDTVLEYINIKEDKIETEIDVDVVPLMIINNDPSQIFKGKSAFDKIDNLIANKPVKTSKKETGGNTYGKTVTFLEQSTKKEKIDLSKK